MLAFLFFCLVVGFLVIVLGFLVFLALVAGFLSGFSEEKK